jgi:hypothetical protein
LSAAPPTWLWLWYMMQCSEHARPEQHRFLKRECSPTCSMSLVANWRWSWP